MTIHDLAHVPQNGSTFGGKADTLGVLLRQGFPVPPGIAIDAEPVSDADWQRIADWLAAQQDVPVAVRSSACGEDGNEHSFAGQHETVLNVSNLQELKDAISLCFRSINASHAQTYRSEMGLSAGAVQMNVLIQVMVTPLYAGVFFSRDPRGNGEHWLMEYVEGLGDDLVSGKVTPRQLTPRDADTPAFNPFQEVLTMGSRAAALLGYDVDMEWAISPDGALHVLQCRPITTTVSPAADALGDYLATVQRDYPPGTVWDGQPFVEWSGQPSAAGFSLWAQAFCPGQSFDRALQLLGYRGFGRTHAPDSTLLDRVCGRPYLNLSRLTPCFYGAVPGRMVATPTAHLTFDWRRLNVATLFNLPAAVLTMLRVAGRVSTSRGALLKQSRAALTEHETRLAQQAQPVPNQVAPLQHALRTRVDTLAGDSLTWSLALITLIQSTCRTLETLLAKECGEAAPSTLQSWMSKDLHTVTMEMHDALAEAQRHSEKQAAFLAHYGHRGPGELDIARPRWSERPETLFRDTPDRAGTRTPEASSTVAEQIAAMAAHRRPIVEQEWQLLREMLQLREQWKMSIMREFQGIRHCLLMLGDLTDLGEDIFHLELNDITNPDRELAGHDVAERIAASKTVAAQFDGITLPTTVALADLVDLVRGDSDATAAQGVGHPLSPGIAQGEIRVVRGDPADVDLSTWPVDVILVAECTDPGWTPLFARARGIVIERGGVLSHCAILARELGIPAVSQVMRCTQTFCDGQRARVNGTIGTIHVLDD